MQNNISVSFVCQRQFCFRVFSVLSTLAIEDPPPKKKEEDSVFNFRDKVGPNHSSAWFYVFKSGIVLIVLSFVFSRIQKEHFETNLTLTTSYFKGSFGISERRCFGNIKQSPVSPGHIFIELLLKAQKVPLKTVWNNYAYQNKVTSQNSMSLVQFKTGILLLYAKQKLL